MSEPRGDPEEPAAPAAPAPASVAREFDATVSTLDFVVASGLGMVGGVGVGLAVILVVSLTVHPPLSFWTWAQVLALPLSVLAFAGATLALRLFPPATAPLFVVGVDGVLVRNRFIPHENIRGVRHDWHFQGAASYGDASSPAEDIWTVYLHLDDGTRLLLRSQGYTRKDMHHGVPLSSDASGAELVRAIEEARTARLAGPRDPDDTEDVIGRGERSGSEWLAALRRLGAATRATYRAVAVDAERLSRQLDDPQARPSSRAAAAVVLAAAGDATSTARLRIAAQSVADPRLRVALQSVAAASNDAARAEALEALDDVERVERVERAGREKRA